MINMYLVGTLCKCADSFCFHRPESEFYPFLKRKIGQFFAFQISQFSLRSVSGSVADPHHFHFDADSDPAYHFDADQNLDPLLIKLMQFCDYWFKDTPQLQFELPRLHSECHGPPWLSI